MELRNITIRQAPRSGSVAPGRSPPREPVRSAGFAGYTCLEEPSSPDRLARGADSPDPAPRESPSMLPANPATFAPRGHGPPALAGAKRSQFPCASPAPNEANFLAPRRRQTKPMANCAGRRGPRRGCRVAPSGPKGELGDLNGLSVGILGRRRPRTVAKSSEVATAPHPGPPPRSAGGGRRMGRRLRAKGRRASHPGATGGTPASARRGEHWRACRQWHPAGPIFLPPPAGCHWRLARQCPTWEHWRACRQWHPAGPIFLPPPAERGGGPGWGAVEETRDFAIVLAVGPRKWLRLDRPLISTGPLC